MGELLGVDFVDEAALLWQAASTRPWLGQSRGAI